ncbi:MAG TPA: RHS repeat-associated core domain-containing protein, partial [Kofleriaceae bacterium]|nr:RHS repeat-associated core domain-containing protein [Kofleriaceae bacterium]
DGLSRIVEQGCYAHAWTGLVPDDPSFPPAAATTAISYDGLVRGDLRALGRVAQAVSQNEVGGPGQTDGFVATERFYYDLAGDVVRTELRADAFQPVDYAVDYRHGNLGEVVELRYPAPGGSPGPTVRYDYDRVGRIAALSVDGTTYIDYRYGVNGKLATETLHGAGATFERTHRWSPPGWQTAITDPIFAETIDYTAGRAGDGGGYYNGSPARITTQPRGTLPLTVRRLRYDALGRLTTVDTGAAASYGYDANGNLTAFTTATLARTGDRLTRRTQGAEVVTYQQDAGGETTSATASPPAPSLVVSPDWLNGMLLSAQVTLPGGTLAQAVRYGYKARRIYQTVTGLDGVTHRALYVRGLGGEPLVVLGDTAGDTAAYVHSPAGPALLLQAGTPYFVSRDYLGSIRGLVDASGALAAGYDYDVYGGDLQPPFGPSAGLSRLRYAARELDVTGLYDFLARLYDPSIGGFTSLDPQHQFSSPYLYVGDNPLRFRDPSGEVAWLLFILIGALVGGAVGSIQAGVVISRKHLTGGKAAGVFFGFLGLGLGAGALAGAGAAAGAAIGAAAGAAVQAATLTAAQAAAINVTTGIAVGAATGAIGGAAQAAGQTALLGGDVARAARNGAAVGALGGAITGTFNGAASAVNTLRGAAVAAAGGVPSAARPTPIQIGLGVLGGSAAGVAQGGLNFALNGGSPTDALVGILQGLAFGALQQAGRLFSIRLDARPAAPPAPGAAPAAPAPAPPAPAPPAPPLPAPAPAPPLPAPAPVNAPPPPPPAQLPDPAS